MVREKNLKIKDIRNASLACVIESMLKKLILFCEIWVLTPCFFDTPLRSHYPILALKLSRKTGLHIAL